MAIELGQPVPDFSAPVTGDTTITLSELRGKQVVIYFYPKASTPGCTTEGGDFRDRKTAFDAANTVVIGVSRDGLRAQENFKAKQDFNFELISDKDETVCQLFDVIKLKKMYGKEHLGIERSTFLIDQDGKLAQEWRGVKVPGHVDEVLSAAQALNSQ
ncbi:MAG: peroxiredoxin [Pseudomonadota bacterium]|jgi:peroxiredoxin Q/BCP|uniref:peroxiredoxin n=1 Tax=Halomonas sp. Ps84H-12 TaxID=2954501 RepID=UPI000E80B62C|nr:MULTISPECIES: peroxiredoxin [unclassified Halomonas]MEC8901765.1 peroxiredoxin [Pseudomonadota bacterium]HAV46241.1 peroxiredoxin [Halomonas sp.]MCO7243231.1 peroxiredoxin [Halomonas sp. Ps84H-12]MEC8937360.1 peroxiredoxin [Pseudomonadota bacterium]MEC9021524.1 peroxiredoxin [Pseudomonadota bacterium]|tara:strand:- start:31 stop:504 length:474 start_codon:yes stop_codon:yes gene_type:complete